MPQWVGGWHELADGGNMRRSAAPSVGSWVSVRLGWCRRARPQLSESQTHTPSSLHSMWASLLSSLPTENSKGGLFLHYLFLFWNKILPVAGPFFLIQILHWKMRLSNCWMNGLQNGADGLGTDWQLISPEFLNFNRTIEDTMFCSKDINVI